MHLNIVSIGHRMPAWVEAGWQEYSTRLPPQLGLKLTELALPKRNKNTPAKVYKDREAEAIRKQLTAETFVVALDENGRGLSTLDWAGKLRSWNEHQLSVAMLIGGPDGLAQSCLQRANEVWSLSKLTLPHPLVRVVLAEQLYRAWSVIQNHPYHRV